eukprot:6034299-Pyramimonas_sp.AAC.1
MSKAMNGLRKAPQNFQDFISTVLTDHIDFTRCLTDPQMLCNIRTSVRVSIHADNPIAVGDKFKIDQFFGQLEKHVLCKRGDRFNDEVPTKYLGRMHVKRDGGIH